MDDVVAFLTARLDEDEQFALPVSHAGNWNIAIHGDPGWGIEGDKRMVDHIVRHDPARVLADVAAKRAIIARLGSYLTSDHDPEPEGLWELLDEHAWATLYDLAAVYADHPDFDPAWRVT